ncbi:hypothetical protein JZ751_002569 [Albula glossodonta]|uniref:DUF4549 domain-containing protein n=1 Tax=Albula glossodonta TaxID=121402 RepID=A0A8T2NEW2_9TELE|nr:hypothetical protein JZ751_002569 [Albula glossodonta]
MTGVYRICSTEKLKLMEKELSSQLSALRTEIEENSILDGSASKSYGSVPIPKDISYFRMEREQILRKGLEVSGARPVSSQVEVMQKELESCRSREYTLESLPLLLHQRQVARLMSEYEDAVQRARRLAVSREKALTSKGNPINAVTEEDVVIYLQWLVCHLHSVKTIHGFLRHLVSYFNIHYNTQDMRTAADEMELLGMVSNEFKAIFRKQEDMRTFLQYGSTEAIETRFSCMERLRKLGLDDKQDRDNDNSTGPQGAYLSLLYLRHLRIRQLQVHFAEFIQFSEVENHHDYYSSEEDHVHIQDARGLYIVYDVALKDLQDLENSVVLVASRYIQKNAGEARR